MIAPDAQSVGRFALAYGVASYLLFLAVFGYFIAFLADYDVPKTVNSGFSGGPVVAVAINLGLVALFGAQHSVMARAWFKRWLARYIHPALERSTYVLAASLALALLMWQWRPVSLMIWRFEGYGERLAAWALFYAGWLVALAGTLQIGHGQLFGLRSVWLAVRGQKQEPQRLVIKGLYRYVRNPVLAGVLLGLWATPDMTAGHLVLAVAMTVYGFVGHYLEERDLLRAYGRRYEAYRKLVPAFLPFGGLLRRLK